MLGVFVSEGRLRPFWRALIYYVAAYWVLQPVFDRLMERLPIPPGLTPFAVAASESELLVIALIVTGILAWYEGRRIDDYGLPFSQAFRGRFFEGFGIGIGSAGLVAAGMIALGGMQVHGLALTGTALLRFAIAWLGANLLVGISEELWYRSYLLQTLWRGIGFWPAAVLIGLLFTADHYFYKAGENVWDCITLFSLSVVMCYSVLRTGTLWFAVGFHVAYDYMQLFVIGTPNGSAVPTGHLLNVTFSGPAWLTGGVLGTEASFLMYPVIALLFLYIAVRNRNRQDFRPEPDRATSAMGVRA